MRINLLPPESKERQRARRQTALVAVIGVILLAAIGGFFFLQQVRLTRAEDDLSEQQTVNQGLQAQIDELQEFDELAAEVEASIGLVGELLANRVLWSGVLGDVALVIPGQIWLDSLDGTITAEQAAGATTATPGTEGLIGNISFAGHGFDHRAVALWLARLEDVSGFVNPWLASSTKTEIGTQEAVDFNSSVDLSTDAVSLPGGAR